MKRPKIYNSELLLQNLVQKSSVAQLVSYLKSLNKYIDRLESEVDLEDIIEPEGVDE